MRSEDRKAFVETILGFAELKSKQLSGVALELYWDAMQDWRIEDFKVAAQLLLKKCAYMPTPKDFEDVRRASSVTASEAWDMILQHCKGAYRNGAGLDKGGPIDTAVAGLGGYRTIAFHDLEYLPILQRQFVDRYEEVRDVVESRRALPDLNTRTKINHDGPRALRDVLPQLQRPKP